MNVVSGLIVYCGVRALERFTSSAVEYITEPIQRRTCDHIQLDNQTGIKDRKLSSEGIVLSPLTSSDTETRVLDAMLPNPDDQQTVEIGTEEIESIERQALSSISSSRFTALREVSSFEAVVRITDLLRHITEFCSDSCFESCSNFFSRNPWSDSFCRNSFKRSLQLLSLNKFQGEQRKEYIIKYGRVLLSTKGDELKKRAEFAERIKLCNIEITISYLGGEGNDQFTKFIYDSKNSELIKRIDSLRVPENKRAAATFDKSYFSKNPCQFLQCIFGLIPETSESQPEPFSLISRNLTSICFGDRYIPCLSKRFPSLVKISISGKDNVHLKDFEKLKSVHIGSISGEQSIILENLTELNNVSIREHCGKKEPVFRNVPCLESISCEQLGDDRSDSIISVPSHVKLLSIYLTKGRDARPIIPEDSVLERLHFKFIRGGEFSHIPKKLTHLKDLIWDRIGGPDEAVFRELEKQIKEREMNQNKG